MSKIYHSLRSLGWRFWNLWLGDSITTLGAQMVTFAIGVYIYEKSGSVLSFAGMTVAGVVPALLVSPFAGAIVDRFDRRRLVITCDCIGAVMAVVFLWAVWAGRLQVEHLYVFAAVSAILNTFIGPAYDASVSAIVPQDQLARASGAMGISQTTLGIIAPTLGGYLLGQIALTGLLALDLLLFCVGAPLAWRAFANFSRIQDPTPGPVPTARRARFSVRGALQSAWDNFIASLAFFEADARLMALLIYSLVQAAMIALASTLVIPLILTQHSAHLLGIALTSGAAGALVGSLLMVTLDNPKRRVLFILICDAIIACCVMLAGTGGPIAYYCLLQFVASAAVAVGASLAYALWMQKVPATQRGSVLVVLSNSAMLVTALTVLAGAAFVAALEVKLASGEGLASLWRQWFDLGKAAAIGIVFAFSGALGLAVSVAGLAYKPLREL